MAASAAAIWARYLDASNAARLPRITVFNANIGLDLYDISL